MTRASRRPPAAGARESQAQRGAAALAQGAPLRTPAAAAALGPAHGTPLPDAVRRPMEQHLGADFSTVRVATDRRAQREAAGFGAHAFAAGEQIAFAAGAWAPGTATGRERIAHELVHVLQQREDGRAAIDCDADASLQSRVSDLQAALSAAADAAARKPLVERALALGDELVAALDKAKQVAPPDGGDAAYDLRMLIRRLGSTLGGVGEAAAAIRLAGKTSDVAVQSAIVNGLPMRSGVGGQQALFSAVAPLAGQQVAPAAAGQNSQQWLKANTPKIGKTLAEFDRRGLKGLKRESLGLEMSEGLLSNYLMHSTVDEKPDPLGDPTGVTLRVDEGSQRIMADCDVYATIGARLLREQGWQTVGYLAIIPNEKKPGDSSRDRDAHAVALASKPVDAADAGKGTLYAGISNTTIRELGGHGVALAGEAQARDELLALALEVYSSSPLTNYDVYYLAAGPGGAYDARILDPKNKGLTPIKSVRP